MESSDTTREKEGCHYISPDKPEVDTIRMIMTIIERETSVQGSEELVRRASTIAFDRLIDLIIKYEDSLIRE